MPEKKQLLNHYVIIRNNKQQSQRKGLIQENHWLLYSNVSNLIKKFAAHSLGNPAL